MVLNYYLHTWYLSITSANVVVGYSQKVRLGLTLPFTDYLSSMVYLIIYTINFKNYDTKFCMGYTRMRTLSD